ncbi:MAG: histidine phosphatase family protein [Chloroflexi bacterium]|nr:histidine phosphatase family protein [Chloroflexota bacterium]
MKTKKWDVFSGTSSEYEKPIDVLNRLKEFVARVCQVHPGGHIVAVTHGHMIMLLTKWVNNESTDIEAMEDVSVPFVSVSTFSYITLKPDTRPDYRYFEPLANKSVKPL